jgi:hypothetical protein
MTLSKNGGKYASTQAHGCPASSFCPIKERALSRIALTIPMPPATGGVGHVIGAAVSRLLAGVDRGGLDFADEQVACAELLLPWGNEDSFFFEEAGDVDLGE